MCVYKFEWTWPLGAGCRRLKTKFSIKPVPVYKQIPLPYCIVAERKIFSEILLTICPQ